MDKIIAKMKNDMQLKGLSALTQDAYLRDAQKFVQFYKKDLRTAKPSDVKRFLTEHIIEKGLTPYTLNQYGAALRFLFLVTLGKKWPRNAIPNAREPHFLPTVLSGTEVIQVLRAFTALKHKTIAIICYGAGLRISEALSLKAKDIDSKRWVIHVRQGKGKKDRQVVLSPRLLKSLRIYWKSERPQGPFLFPGKNKGSHLSRRSFTEALYKAVTKSGVKKHVSAHVFRHSYATHMIESGVDLRSVQLLLGHSSLKSTIKYVHLTNCRMQNITSPLELLGRPDGDRLG